MEATIEVSGLRKRFGLTLALDGMSFTVRPGQVTGFVGPNGAGKPVTGLRHSFPAGKRPPCAG
jgi:ABC-2 type transport system ATP-binding protein